ncbi:MAG: GDSL-type esterase/lipase family protein [Chitinophagaceae bacterium]
MLRLKKTNALLINHQKKPRINYNSVHFILPFLLLATFSNCSNKLNPKKQNTKEALYPAPSTIILYHNNQWARDNYTKRIQEFKNDPLLFGETVFIGNSLTEQGGDWSIKFGLKGIRNRGIAGDVTDGVIKRLDEIIFYKPKAVFLLIGVNDIFNLQGGGGIASANYIANNIISIASKIKQGSPNSHIYIQTILPSTNELKMNTQLINSIIKNNDSKGNYTVIDLYSGFTNSQGLMPQEFTTDGLHLNNLGYKVWISLLDTVIRM